MTTEQGKSVELAVKHGAEIVGEIANGMPLLSIAEDQLTAMRADHRQQVIDELAQQHDAGKRALKAVDSLDDCARMNVGINASGAVNAAREAIAAMQARIGKEQREVARLTAAFFNEHAVLKRAEARVEQLENALERIIGMCDVPATCTCGRPNGLPAVVACANAAMKGASK